jgi:hypothetical protein
VIKPAVYDSRDTLPEDKKHKERMKKHGKNKCDALA